MTKLARAFAHEEGFGRPGKIPTIRHNPGDLRHSPHSQHPGGPAHKDDIGTIDTDEHGWQDLHRQLGIFAVMGLTIRQAVNIYLGVPRDATEAQLAAAPDRNNVLVYLAGVCHTMALSPETLVSNALMAV